MTAWIQSSWFFFSNSATKILYLKTGAMLGLNTHFIQINFNVLQTNSLKDCHPKLKISYLFPSRQLTAEAKK